MRETAIIGALPAYRLNVNATVKPLSNTPIILCRFDEDTKRVELDYPRNMAVWRGVGYNIDSAFQWKDHKTYFFKGKGFWKFSDHGMRVEEENPKPSAHFWMRCPREHGGRENDDYYPTKRERILSEVTPTSASPSSQVTVQPYILALITLALIMPFRWSWLH